jgi:hypothetical protein
LPKWIQRRFELSRQALTKLSRERGKTLRVTKDVDMLGI